MRKAGLGIGGAALGMLAAGFLTGGTAALPERVDLRKQQTPIRLQTRSNCFIHATVAAMEAAYKRAGHGDLDLSELFSDTMGELFFLEYCEKDGPYYTRRMRVPGARERETILLLDHAMTVESAAPCMILGIPEERYAPFKPLPGPLSPKSDPQDPYWSDQFNVSAYNLDPQQIPLAALTAPLYYRIGSIQWLSKESAADPAALEEVLAQGREVIWDFKQAGDISGDVWRYTGPADPTGPGHRLLLVGYDRSDARNPYFIAKNSWGATRTPGADGFTFISYDYLQYGEWAHFITRVEPPRPCPAYKFLGRWSVECGDLRGMLDIYHLPGMMERIFKENGFTDAAGLVIQDRRLGTFYRNGDAGQPCRVNGNIISDVGIELFIDFDNFAPRWDVCRGSMIVFKIHASNPIMMEGDGPAPGGGRVYAVARRVKVK